MGSKSQPAPPPPPDPREIARADAEFNRINQITPFGSLQFQGPNRNTAVLELDPRVQGLVDERIGLDSGLLGTAGQALPGIENLIQDPLTTQGLPQLQAPQLQGLDLSGLPGLPGDVEPFREDIEQAFFERSSGLLDEQFQREEERLRQRLSNQGLQAGGEAFGDELGQFNQRRGETFENLARDAVLFGGQESSRALGDQLALRGAGFGERLTGTDFANQLAQQQLQNRAGIRSQLLSERGQLRGNQFNELASLLGLQQVQPPGMQNFFAPSQVGVGDAFALNQSAQQNAFNAQSANARAAKGATAGLAGTLGGAALMGPAGAALGKRIGGKG